MMLLPLLGVGLAPRLYCQFDALFVSDAIAQRASVRVYRLSGGRLPGGMNVLISCVCLSTVISMYNSGRHPGL